MSPESTLLSEAITKRTPEQGVGTLQPRRASTCSAWASAPFSEDGVRHVGSASPYIITWPIVSGFKGRENDAVPLAALTDIETDWHQSAAYLGMLRTCTRPRPALSPCGCPRLEGTLRRTWHYHLPLHTPL